MEHSTLVEVVGEQALGAPASRRPGTLERRAAAEDTRRAVQGRRPAARLIAVCVVACLGTAALGSLPASAQEVSCEQGTYPCGFGLEGLTLQPVPLTFKFQARLAQAKVLVPDGEFSRVVARLVVGDQTLCQEEFSDVGVADSKINLEIGRNISCDLDRVLAEHHEPSLVVCLGGTDNCLRPVVLAAVPQVFKASHALRVWQADRADVAAEANYVQRLSADRQLLLTRRPYTGSFDFQTPPLSGNAEAAGAGFLQWTPLQQAQPTLHLAAKDPATDAPALLGQLVLAAEQTEVAGRLDVLGDGVHVKGASDVKGDLTVRGQLKVEKPQDEGAEGARVRGLLAVDGTLRVDEGLIVRAGGMEVLGDSEIGGDLRTVGEVQVDRFLDGSPSGLEVSGSGAVKGRLAVGNGVRIATGGAEVGGDGALDGNLAVGQDVSARNLTVRGRLTVLGDVEAPARDVMALLGPDGDPDGDWVANADDNCPFATNEDQSDLDGDELGDVCDPDRDGDGTANPADCMPDEPTAYPNTLADAVCNGLDNDCDGQTDEDHVSANCVSGLPGLCSAGTTRCQGGVVRCVPTRQPVAELCDGQDNDCDGSVDEGVCQLACGNRNGGGSLAENGRGGNYCYNAGDSIQVRARKACESYFGEGRCCVIGGGYNSQQYGLCGQGGYGGTIHWHYDSYPAGHCPPYYRVGDVVSQGWCGSVVGNFLD